LSPSRRWVKLQPTHAGWPFWGIGKLELRNPGAGASEEMKAFSALAQSALAKAQAKTKELIAIAVSAGHARRRTSARADLRNIALVGDTFSAATEGMAENVLDYSPAAPSI
jgi:hypothetical protein